MLAEEKEQLIKFLKRKKLDVPEGSGIQVDYGKAEIEQIIPHRAPFALIDKITFLDTENQFVITETVLDENDPVFAGHFPGHPVYPGVLQIEMMGQAGLCLIYFLQNKTTLVSPKNRSIKGLFTRVHNTGFIQPAYPGDKLEVRASMIECDDFLGIMKVQVWKGDKICSHSILEAFLVDED